MAARSSPVEGDKRSYINYVAKVQQERNLLDQKEATTAEIKFLNQTLSYLVLRSTATDPATDPAVIAVANVMKARKTTLADVVSKTYNT